MMRTPATLLVAGAALLWGCDGLGKPARSGPDSRQGGGAAGEGTRRADPLPVQQARAYPETATGLFVSLADFEDVPGGKRGHEQVAHFAIRPDAPGARREFVVNITRTGVGALEVTLPAGSQLVFRSPHVHDFRGSKLLSMAVYARSLRDDLRVRLETDGAPWRSQRALVRPGWNNVLIDIQRLSEVPGFDMTSVRSIGIEFADAAGPVWFNLDDVMAIDNARAIRPSPPGVVLHKSGLDYKLTLPGRSGALGLRQGRDGLWRLEGLQARLRLVAPGEAPGSGDEPLALMGRRRVGQVVLLEHNAVRLRLANTWYFPRRAGQWASLAVPRIRWEHTGYADGRWVTQGTLNNAGGREIGAADLSLPQQAAWRGGGTAKRLVLRDFPGEVGRWQYLIPPPGARAATVAANYLRPGRLEPAIAAEGAFAAGDADRDGFDESQGCYFLRARRGQCRFTVLPPPEGLWHPVFLVAGQWRGPVHVTSEGLAIRRVARRTDGSVLFVLPGHVRRSTAVEVTGKPAGPAHP